MRDGLPKLGPNDTILDRQGQRAAAAIRAAPRAVDPRECLTPLPTATTQQFHSGWTGLSSLTEPSG
jgi:hypothetical protein